MIISAFLIGVATTFFTNFALRMKMTFYDYLNRLRIERAAIPLMREHPETSTNTLHRKAAFLPSTLFVVLFVKVTGRTPSQYSLSLTSPSGERPS